MQLVEQVGQLPGRTHPEQGSGVGLGAVVVGVREAARHQHRVAGARLLPLSVEVEREDPVEDVDVLVLGGVNVRRHAGAGRVEGLEGEAGLADGPRPVGVAEHVPHPPVLTLPGAHDALGEGTQHDLVTVEHGRTVVRRRHRSPEAPVITDDGLPGAG